MQSDHSRSCTYVYLSRSDVLMCVCVCVCVSLVVSVYRDECGEAFRQWWCPCQTAPLRINPFPVCSLDSNGYAYIHLCMWVRMCVHVCVQVNDWMRIRKRDGGERERERERERGHPYMHNFSHNFNSSTHKIKFAMAFPVNLIVIAQWPLQRRILEIPSNSDAGPCATVLITNWS